MTSASKLIVTEGICRSFRLGSEVIHAVRDVTLEVLPGQFMALIGRSGSGKTTLLNLMAGLDHPSSGRILIEGRDVSKLTEDELMEVRRHKVGFVFQSFGLLPLLSARENVELPMRIAGVPPGDRDRRALEVLNMVGLVKRASHRPYELSGGEQQRVAIARAIVNRPLVVLADEPTGELDSTNARAIFGLFANMVRDQGITVVAATHDASLLEMADVVHEMRGGALLDHAERTLRYQD